MILIFGGSFDPVHRGHVETARAAQRAVAATRLVWLPTSRSPLKDRSRSTPAQREAMLRLMLAANAGDAGWSLDLGELHAPPPAYTIDSLRRWRAEVGPQQPLGFLMGRDSLQGLMQWRHWQALTDVAHLVIASRPGHAVALPESLQNWLENRQISRPELLQSRPFGHVLLLDTPPWPVSSTDLRSALTDQRPTRDWLEPAIRDYIDQHGLYRSPENPAAS